MQRRNRKHRPVRSTRLTMESLEARRCLAASVTNIGNFNTTDPYQGVGDIKVVGDAIYFLDGGQLFKTDSAGTIALTETGPFGSQPLFTEFNGNLYFQNFDSVNQFELWRTDGTVAGTAMVKNVSSLKYNVSITSLQVFNNQLYFVSDGNLYSSDGTAAGTNQLVDIVPGASDGVANLTAHNSALYFSSQSKLYKSDGTSAGTSQLVNSPTGGYGGLTSTPGSLYFNAGNLWRLDDTTQQFQIIGSAARSLAEMNGRVYFSSGDTLWKTNATADGAEEVSVPGGDVFNLFNFQGTLFFAAGEDIYGPGTELWRSDGTAAGTFMVKDVEPRQFLYFADLAGESSNPGRFTTFNGELYFVATSTAGETSDVPGLWKTNGTEAGTVQVHQGTVRALTQNAQSLYFGAPTANGEKLLRLDLNGQVTMVPRNGTGTGSFAPMPAAVINGQTILFGNTGQLGTELYRLNSDNTLSLIVDLTPGAASTVVQGTALFGNLLYFVANGHLYRTDGTAAGTLALMPFNRLDAMVAVGNQLFIAGEQATTGAELWKTDGTVAGTVLVKDIGGPGASSNPRELIEFNGKLYFTAISAGKRTIWQSDGTAAGTKLVINVPMLDSSWLRVVQNQLYFSTFAGHLYRIYRSDGTQAGTNAVSDFQRLGDPSQAIVLGNTLFFAAKTATYGEELFKIVGSGTPQLVKDIYSGVNGSSPGGFTVFNNKLYFVAFRPSNGIELWESSGTSATTQSLEINPGSNSSNPTILGSAGGVLFLAATDTLHGRELWQTNGVASGVTMVADILPGISSSNPSKMLVRNQDAIFSAYTNPLGEELWSVRSAAPMMTLPTVAANEYREGSAPVRLAPQALVDDTDNAVLLGGTLKASLGTSFRTGDQVLLARTSTVSLNGTTVLVSGIAVGTLTTSGAGRDLRVDFTRSGTKAQVREVIRAVAFQHTTISPVPGERSVRFDLTDGSSGQSVPRVVRINVVPLDTLPVISGLSSTATSTLNSTGFAFAATAVVSDDNFNMAGGELTVHFNNSRDYTRTLISLGGPTFWKDAQNNVYRGNVVIGTMNPGGGVGATALRITFNEKVTPAIAQELLRSLRLSTPGSTTTGVRIPWIRISDGSRGFSEVVTRPYISINS